MRLLRASCAIAALSLVAPAAVLAQQGQDELWETSMSMQSDGMKMPAMTQQICTPKGKREERMQMDKNCRMVESKQVGSKFTFKVECEEGKDRYTGTGEMEDLGKDAYKGFMTASGTRDGEKFSMRMDMSGKRVGNCTWEDPAKKVAAIEKQQKDMMAKECDRMLGDLEPGMFFGYEGLPPEAAICRDRQADFCAAAGRTLKGIKDREAWDKARNRYGDKLTRSATACKLDIAATRGPLCKEAQDKAEWRWFGSNCPEAAAMRKEHCIGRTYDTVEKKYAEMCSILGGLAYTVADAEQEKTGEGSSAGKPATAGGATAGGAAAGGAAGAEQPKKPSTTDKLKEGADKLKKFLKF